MIVSDLDLASSRKAKEIGNVKCSIPNELLHHGRTAVVSDVHTIHLQCKLAGSLLLRYQVEVLLLGLVYIVMSNASGNVAVPE